MGVSCDVIAPSLIPKAAGDKIKTDQRDARVARLHRAGELTAIHIPTPEQEAVRDLRRARVDVVPRRSDQPTTTGGTPWSSSRCDSSCLRGSRAAGTSVSTISTHATQ